MTARIVAALLLLGTLPLTLLFALGIQLASPGPLLFRQVRVGRHGKPFGIWKLRTMVVRAERVLDDVLKKDPAMAAEWATYGRFERDPRIAGPWARLARRFSVDELPQLLNVMAGEMGFIGPRPLLPQQAVLLPCASIQLRHSVRPGLTGLWQVNGRSETTLEDMMTWDCLYVSSRSMKLDFYILLKTLPAVLGARGAY